jgi:hypothetical protein
MANSRKARKSLIDQYKAKARGKKTSKVSKENSAPARPTRIPITEMTVGDRTYSKGDIAWFVLEAGWHSKRPSTGEILECHPNDKIEPSVSIWDETTCCYRTIRASLIGWSKIEAKKNWELFLKRTK